ncbi:MAG: FAD-dependent protein [Syntrophomonas sp.]
MMKVRVRDLRLPLDFEEADLWREAARSLAISEADIANLTLARQAVDARRSQVYFSITLDLELKEGTRLAPDFLKGPQAVLLEPPQKPALLNGATALPFSPTIIGAGPAGLFCALLLARRGYHPVLFERGYDVDKRVRAVESFWSRGNFDQDGNAQFGEGGAGTFSDGKLTTRIGDNRVRLVLDAFVEHGADPQIAYQKKPHVGTDVIRQVVKSIRQEIIDRGGQVHFQSRLSDIHINQTAVESITINDKAQVPCSVLVLAIGNSARDVFRLLAQRGVSLTPKAFAVGVRIEHQQDFIDRTQYGDYAGHPRLGAADYHLTYQDRQAGRSFYTFCMCPGGYVIGAASEAGQVVINGMSCAARDSGRANSAVVVTVGPNDWGNSALGGVELQESLERRAFQMGGGDYRAPAQLVQDFLRHRSSISLKGSLATFRPGVNAVNLWDLFPPELCQVMERGLNNWERRMPGFTSGPAVLTGVETRTSSPLRIVRGENLNSISLDNLYPCGEGSGYAGGIVSSAVDGLRVAEKIISIYNKPDKVFYFE